MNNFKRIKFYKFAFSITALLMFILVFSGSVFAAQTSEEILNSNCPKEDVSCMLQTSAALLSRSISISINITLDNTKTKLINFGSTLQSTSSALSSGWSIFTNVLLNNSINSLSLHKQLADRLSNNLTKGVIAYTNIITSIPDRTSRALIITKELGKNTTASVGSSLLGASNGISDGWISFTNTLLNNVKESFNNTKDIALSIWNNLTTPTPAPKVIVPTSLVTTKTTPTQTPSVPLSGETNTTPKVASSIINNITQQQRDVYINQYDPAIIPRIQGIEKALQNSITFNTTQTDRIYYSLGRSISSASDNITEDGTLNDTTLNRPDINNAVITDSSFSGTTGIYTGNVTAPTFTGNLIGNMTGVLTGNADTVTNGVYTSRTVNGHPLSDDVTVTPTDLGLVIGTDVLAQRTFGTAADNNTEDFLLYNATAVNSSLLENHNALYFQTALTNPVTGTGTTNYLPKFSGTSTLSNSLIYDNGTNVGIGTTTPQGLLSIAGGDVYIDSSDQNAGTLPNGSVGPGLRFGGVSTGEGIASKRTATGNQNGLDFYTSYINRMAITNTGNVGIGTTGPAYKLHVAGLNAKSGAAERVLNLSSSDDAAQLRMGFVIGNNVTDTLRYTSIQSVEETAGYRSLALNPNGGNVGIGTTGPDALTEIKSSNSPSASGGEVLRLNANILWATVGSGPKLLFRGSDAGTSFSDMASIRGYVFGSGLSGLAFETGHNALTTKMVIDNTGSLGIGTTNPLNKLHVEGTGGGAAGIYINSAAPASGTYTLYNNGGILYWNGNLLSTGSGSALTGSGVANYLSKWTSTSVIGTSSIYDNGTNVGIGTTAPGQKLTVTGGSLAVENGNVYLASDNLLSFNYGVDNNYIINKTGTRLHFNTGGTFDFMSGNVGIGTTSPTRTLGFGGNVARNIGMERGIVSNTDGYDLTVNAGGATSGALDGNGGNLYLTSGISTGGGTGNIYFQTSPAVVQTGGLKTVSIASGGTGYNVGNVLAVVGGTGGTVTVTSVNGGGQVLGISITNAGSGYSPGIFIQTTGGDGVWFMLDITAITIGTSDNALATAMTIKAGNVGIGTTNPLALLNVKGSIAADALVRLQNTAADGSSGIDIFTENGTLAGSFWHAGASSGATNNRGALTLASRISGEPIYIVAGGYDPTVSGGITVKAGNVGIGTTGPTNNLHILSTTNENGITIETATDNAYLTLKNTGTNGTSWNLAGTSGSSSYGGSTGNFAIAENATTARLVIQKGGNVGIGTTAPGAKLQIGATALGTGVPIGSSLAITGDGAAGRAIFNSGSKVLYMNVWNGANYAEFSTYDYNAGAIPNLVFNANGGNVGIGLVAPGEKLSVAGHLMVGDATWSAGTVTNGDVAIQGNVGIGTTGPGYKLDVNGTINNPKFNINTAAYSSYVADGLYGATASPSVYIPNPSNPIGLILFGYKDAGGGQYAPRIGFQALSPNTATKSSIGLEPTSGDFTINGGASNSEYMRILATNGNVGIGTTGPGAKLEIDDPSSTSGIILKSTAANAAGNGGLIDFQGDYGGDNALSFAKIEGRKYNADNGDVRGYLRFSVSNTFSGSNEVMRIVGDYAGGTSGNVGIGTTTPGWQTVINGAGQVFSGAANITDTGNKGGSLLLAATDAGVGSGGALLFGAEGSGNNTPNNFFAAIKGQHNNGSYYTTGDLAFSTRNTSVDTALTERMRILSNGNVGIGTTGPGAKLDIYKLNPSTTDHSANLLLTSDYGSATAGGFGGALAFIDRTPGNLLIESARIETQQNAATNAASLLFYTNIGGGGSAWDTEKMRITSGGNVGIGTTGPAYKLDVQGPIGGGIAGFRTSNGLAAYLEDNSGYTDLYLYQIGYNAKIALSTNGNSYLNGGNVGIGTTAPQGTLETHSATDQNLLIRGALSLADGISIYSVNDANNLTKGMEFAASKYYFSNGNVGIGTTNPTHKLEVNTTVDGEQSSISLSNEGAVGGNNVRSALIGKWYGNDTAALKFHRGEDVTGGALSLWTAYGIDNVLIDRLHILPNGNVGIGTTGPTGKLDIETPEDTWGVSLLRSGTRVGGLQSNSGILRFEAVTGGAYVALGNNGNVGIGTTNPGAKLEVFDNDAASTYTTTNNAAQVVINNQDITNTNHKLAKLLFRSVSSNGWNSYSAIGVDPSNLSNSGDLFFSTSVGDGNSGNAYLLAERMRITTSGNVGIGTTNPTNILTIQQTSATDPIADAWTTYSSGRWKENRVPIVNALENIKRLNPVYFDWTAEHGGAHDLGFIAEEVGVIIPEVVAWEENGTDAKSIDYGRLSTIAIAGVKELNLKLENINTFETDEEGNNIVNTLRDKFIAWFGNVGNGIGDIFAGTFKATDKLCINETCVTESQLQELLANANVENTPCVAPNTMVEGVCTPPVETCISPKILVGDVCIDPPPATITLSSISITTPATKTSYIVNDTLDISGLVVTGTYSDASTKAETIIASNVTGFDSAAIIASQTLTITIGDKTATYTIEVK